MKIWKPLERFKNKRKEWAWHTDFALEEGEVLSLSMGNPMRSSNISRVLELCPKGKMYKVHLEICVEPFDVEKPKYEEEEYVPNTGRINYGGEYRVKK